MAKHPPTRQQADIVRAASTIIAEHRAGRPLRHLKVSAFSGTGKTSTLIQIAAAQKDKRGLYIAFNKPIQIEAERKFAGMNVTAKTSHALAYIATRVFERSSRLVPRIFPDQAAALAIGQRSSYSGKLILDTITNFCQSADLEISGKHLPMEVAGGSTESGILAQHRWLITGAERLWAMMSSPNGDVPFTHDVYLKQWQLSGADLPGYDYLMFDEAQDANPVTLDIVLRQGIPVIFVGDENQEIYGFRGAINAMRVIDAEEQFLTQSFRFGQNIADIGNHILSAKPAGRVPKYSLLGDPSRQSSVYGIDPASLHSSPPMEVKSAEQDPERFPVVRSRRISVSRQWVGGYSFDGRLVSLGHLAGAEALDADRPRSLYRRSSYDRWWKIWKDADDGAVRKELVSFELMEKLLDITQDLQPSADTINMSRSAVGQGADESDGAALEARQKGNGSRQKVILTRTNGQLFRLAIDTKETLHIIGGIDDFCRMLLTADALRKDRPLRSDTDPVIARFATWAELEKFTRETDDLEFQQIIKILKKEGDGLRGRINDLRNRVTEEARAALILSTAHKAKGCEWDDVELADDFPVPSDVADERWAQMSVDAREAELNLLYVASTRAKNSLKVNAAVIECRPGICDIPVAVKKVPPSQSAVLSNKSNSKMAFAKAGAPSDGGAERGKGLPAGCAGTRGKQVDQHGFIAPARFGSVRGWKAGFTADGDLVRIEDRQGHLSNVLCQAMDGRWWVASFDSAQEVVVSRRATNADNVRKFASERGIPLRLPPKAPLSQNGGGGSTGQCSRHRAVDEGPGV